MANGKLFSCRNRLLRHDMQWQIKLSQDLLAGAINGVFQESVVRRA